MHKTPFVLADISPCQGANMARIFPSLEKEGDRGGWKLNDIRNLLPVVGARETVKPAFTLAEVLITLAIIGIVAALTIPALMSSYHRHIVETRLRDVHSTMLQAFKMAQAENGDFIIDVAAGEDVDQNGYSPKRSQAMFEKYFAPVFKSATPYSKGNKSSYSADGTQLLESRVFYASSYFVMLNNGTLLGFLKDGNSSSLRVIVIVNPQKDKLISGRDIFEFHYEPGRFSGGYEYNSRIKRNYSSSDRQKFLDACTSNESYPLYALTTSEFCAFLIVENNFKIPDDYPIKI